MSYFQNFSPLRCGNNENINCESEICQRDLFHQENEDENVDESYNIQHL